MLVTVILILILTCSRSADVPVAPYDGVLVLVVGVLAAYDGILAPCDDVLLPYDDVLVLVAVVAVHVDAGAAADVDDP